MDVSTTRRVQGAGAAAGKPWSTEIGWNGRLLTLECAESISELEALSDEWRALQRRCPEPFTYFQSFDWCSNWCKAFLAEEEKADIRPKIYVLREGADCVMIWPLMSRRVAVSVTVLLSLSAPLNQYASLIYDPTRFNLTIGRAVFEQIKDRGGRDAICLDHVPAGGLLAKIIAGQGYSAAMPMQSSILDLKDIADWDSYHGTLPKKQRLQRNSRRNKLQKLGALDYRILTPQSDEYQSKLELCLALKQEWLKNSGRVGDIFDPRFAAFLRDLGKVPDQDDGGVFLHELTLDGLPIALEVGIRFHGDYYCFLGAIDLTYQRYSPGKVQMEASQRWAIDSGIRRFDFLNDPSTYKSSWTNTTEPLDARYIPFNSLGTLYCRHWMAGLRPHVRSLYHRIGPEIRARLLPAVDALKRVLGRNSSAMALMACCIP